MIRTAREEAVKFCWFRHSNERVTPEEPGKTKEKSCRLAQVYSPPPECVTFRLVFSNICQSHGRLGRLLVINLSLIGLGST